jgi:putative spermidine/putrescine transport system ATP-binding protein/putrescine transport system ATP-binding protein
MSDRRPYERNVGLVFQNYALFPHLKVRENVAFGLGYRRWPRNRLDERVSEMLDLVKLRGMESRFPFQLSGGQQQRVALARALATEPEVVLLDEPLSALDAKLRHELRVELKEILRVVGSTTIIVTHDQEEALGMAERVLVLKQGRLQQEGTPETVYARPRNRFVAEFVGRSNWFSGECESRDASRWSIRCDDDVTFAVPPQNHCVEIHFDIGVRPESIEIDAGDQPIDDERNRLEGRVMDIAILGAERQVSVKLSSGRHVLVLDNTRSDVLRVGQAVSLYIHLEDCIVLPRGRQNEAERSGDPDRDRTS